MQFYPTISLPIVFPSAIGFTRRQAVCPAAGCDIRYIINISFPCNWPTFVFAKNGTDPSSRIAHHNSGDVFHNYSVDINEQAGTRPDSLRDTVDALAQVIDVSIVRGKRERKKRNYTTVNFAPERCFNGSLFPLKHTDKIEPSEF